MVEIKIIFWLGVGLGILVLFLKAKNSWPMDKGGKLF